MRRLDIETAAITAALVIVVGLWMRATIGLIDARHAVVMENNR